MDSTIVSSAATAEPREGWQHRPEAPAVSHPPEAQQELTSEPGAQTVSGSRNAARISNRMLIMLEYFRMLSAVICTITYGSTAIVDRVPSARNPNRSALTANHTWNLHHLPGFPECCRSARPILASVTFWLVTYRPEAYNGRLAVTAPRPAGFSAGSRGILLSCE